MDIFEFLEKDAEQRETVVFKQYLGNHCEVKEVTTDTPANLQKKFESIVVDMANQKKHGIPLKVTMTGSNGRYLEFKNWRDEE